MVGQRRLDRLSLAVVRLKDGVERILVEVSLADGGQEAVDCRRQVVDGVGGVDGLAGAWCRRRGRLAACHQLAEPRPLAEAPQYEVDDLVVVRLQGDVATNPRERLVEDSEEHVDEDVVDAEDVEEEEDGAENGTRRLHRVEVELTDEHL